MSVEALPLADAALHPDWPRARFNVSGMFVHQPLLMEFINILEDGLECRVPIESAHGAPAVMWNAGRPSYARPDRAAIKADLQRLYDRNISYYATFSNNRLDSDDLHDPLANYMLDMMGERPELNGVIVTSDLLSSYIAEKHPRLPQFASIVKISFENGKGRLDYYRKLGERFSRYIIHPDDCRNFELLEQLDRDKTEIILNEECVVHCPNRPRHYDVYARWQKILSASQADLRDPMTIATERMVIEQEMKQMTLGCPVPNDLPCIKRHKRSCNLTPAEFKAIHDMGFRHFKIQGRGNSAVVYFYDLTRYMLDPEFAAPLMFKTMMRYIPAALAGGNKFA